MWRDRRAGREARPQAEEPIAESEGSTTPVSQALLASESRRALTQDLMEAVLAKDNMNTAHKKVKANKGAAGIDGMTVKEMLGWLKIHKEELLASLRNGTYQPQAVKAVDIPKPDGSLRRLGIPTAIDRLILQPLYDPWFSESSYGFRPQRSAHQALEAGSGYVRGGRKIVVDMDLEKFFDRVNHDKLMGLLAQTIGDKRLLKLIRRYLEAGMMIEGVISQRQEGTPQGGPLSPLLANILLDPLDKELEQRGHRFCRYADDCNIYVKSIKAGERVMKSISTFIQERLKLRVNENKSKVAPVEERKFLGYQITQEGQLRVAEQSITKLKERVKMITKRNRGIELSKVIEELRNYLTGWVTYYRLIHSATYLQRLDNWIRRKVRCYRLKQTGGGKGLLRFLTNQGVTPKKAHELSSSGKGWWRLSHTPQAHIAMSNDWCRNIGLISLAERYNTLNPFKKPPDTLSMSGGVGGRQG
jgi:RNA-directed DNA polymerase